MVTACKEHTKVIQDSTPSQYDSDTAVNSSAIHPFTRDNRWMASKNVKKPGV